jgi:membrane fusion protein (multidrug efflux system)
MQFATCVATATLMLTACGKKGPPAPPPVEVAAITVAPQAATVAEDYVAQTEAVNTVEIRPRVGGVLEKQLPNEGERLKVGQLLFVIDQQPYIAALTQAQAALAQSQAALIQSQRDLGRAGRDRRQERGQPGLC